MPAVLIRTECRGMFDTHRINIEGFCHGNSCYQGTPESLEHMLELLSAMRIDIEELALDKDI